MHEGEISPFHLIQNACSSYIFPTFSQHFPNISPFFRGFFPPFSQHFPIRRPDLVGLHGGCNGSAGSRDLGDLLNLWLFNYEQYNNYGILLWLFNYQYQYLTITMVI